MKNSNTELWSSLDQLAVERYVISNDKETKDKLYSLLYPTLQRLIQVVSLKYRFNLDEDEEQIILIRLYEYSLDKISQEKVKAAQSYLYNAIVNTARNCVRNRNTKYNHSRLSEPLSYFHSGNEEYNDIDSVVQHIALNPDEWLYEMDIEID